MLRKLGMEEEEHENLCWRLRPKLGVAGGRDDRGGVLESSGARVKLEMG